MVLDKYKGILNIVKNCTHKQQRMINVYIQWLWKGFGKIIYCGEYFTPHSILNEAEPSIAINSGKKLTTHKLDGVGAIDNRPSTN